MTLGDHWVTGKGVGTGGKVTKPFSRTGGAEDGKRPRGLMQFDWAQRVVVGRNCTGGRERFHKSLAENVADLMASRLEALRYGPAAAGEICASG